jgi:zinc protease
VAQLAVYGLADEYWQTYREHLSEVSTADVLAAAQELIHPDQLVFLVVGDARRIRSPLEESGLGPLELTAAN